MIEAKITSNKLWLLHPQKNLSSNDNPWIPWYDKYFGFVIRASSEESARMIADEAASASDENRNHHPWLDPKYSSCVELLAEGPAEVIIADFAAA